MRINLRSSMQLTLGGVVLLILSNMATSNAQGQEKWPLYLPIAAHASGSPHSVPNEQGTPGSATPTRSATATAPSTATAEVTVRSTVRPTAEATPNATPNATPTEQSTAPPVSPPGGLWLTQAELSHLPTAGNAWDNLTAAADEHAATPDLGDQDTDANVQVLAKALVYARTGQSAYLAEVLEALQSITNERTEEEGRTLALGRELAAYVMAADLIGLPHVDAELDARFRARLRELLSKPLAGWGSEKRTLQETHELRPNNWGTHAGASRAAVAVYLDDKTELARTAQVFHGYLGDLAAYSGFEYADDVTWQAHPSRPVGINPAGAVKDGHSIDGALPEEMRRGGSFQWPPAATHYPWEGLQGAFLQAEILARAGYPVWEWEDRALLRAVEFLYDIGWPAENDDEWIPWMVNSVYGTDFPTHEKAHAGKNVGWTDWTHGH